ncbi:protein kinase, ATP binding site-containing protein [Tanacetum coccineum]
MHELPFWILPVIKSKQTRSFEGLYGLFFVEKEDLEKFTRENSSIRRGSHLHDNIVSLLGFCDDCGEKILVYDYASKRSLNFYLNDKDLTWVQRIKICIGAARGLAYLHNPDFGLSKFGPANQRYTFLVSNGVGTMGYNYDKRLTALVRECYKQKTIADIVYGNIKDEINHDSLKAFTTIAYQCLNRDQEQRPLMTEVVEMLESARICQT